MLSTSEWKKGNNTMGSSPRKVTSTRLFLLLLCLTALPGLSRAQSSCTYTELARIAARDRTAHVLAVDLNRDGVPDVVGTNHTGMALTKGTITVALGTGSGKFEAPKTYTLGDAGPYETTAADFNGDGFPDLAVELFGTSDRTIIGIEVDVFLNNGDGTFKPFVAYATGNKCRAVKSADLNRDGRQDLIVANSQDGTVGVLLGKGDGTFGSRRDYPAGPNPHGLAVADFNRDGSPDIAACNNIFHPDGAVNVMLGNGDGSLSEPVQYKVGAGAFGLDAGDLNGDGYPDIVSASNRAASVSVLINTGTGTFKEAVGYPATAQPIAVNVGDLQGDGKLDVLSSSRQGTDMLAGNGDGTLQPFMLVDTGSAYDSALADFDGDGVMDFASAVTSGHMVIMKGICNRD